MDWNANLRPPFVFRPENSFNFLFNYDHYPGVEMKYPVVTQPSQAVVGGMDKSGSCYGNQLEKKKRLTNEQLDSLESNFQEEIKLDPERKMKLARELGLQPRQIAVWFQNRRARWKAKQVERLYEVLKQEFDTVSKEKQKLQEEVSALKALLHDQAMKKQVSRGQTEISGEETVESTSVENQGSGKVGETSHQQNIADQGNYVFSVDDYNPAMPPYWGSFLPSYP